MNTQLGRRQRQALDDLASQGMWHPNREIGMGELGGAMRISQVRAVMDSLCARGLVYFRPGRRDGYALTPAGYAVLIHRAADELGWMPADYPEYEKVTTRIQHLASLARLAADSPVNWKGESAT